MGDKNIQKELPKIVYAGNRDIGIWVLKFMIEQGVKPELLILSSNADLELISSWGCFDASQLLMAGQLKTEGGIGLLKQIEPDYIICVHFHYLIPPEILEIPKYGVLNLHPSYLPYNRGWHTATWAIWDGTPYGATLHFMDEGIDTGDIVHQKRIEILPYDTADTLYKRVKQLEFEVFKEAWQSIVNGNYKRKKQRLLYRTILKKKADITSLQCIDNEKNMWWLMTCLRALTTSDIKEAAFFTSGDKKYRVQVHIEEEKGD